MTHTTTEQIQNILNGTVDCNLPYPGFLERLHDDTDGSADIKHVLSVSQGPDGDMYVGVGHYLLRFRTWTGGGISLATHNALRILAEAIKMDNQARPQR